MELGVSRIWQMIGNERKGNKPVYATATVLRKDDDGTVWVQINGGTDETPAYSTTADVKQNDVVTVKVTGGRVYIDGSTSNPSIDVVRLDKTVAPISDKVALLEADAIKVRNLTAESLSAATAYIAQLSAEEITASNVIANITKVSDLTADELSAATAYIAALVSKSITTDTISADHASIDTLKAETADIGTIRANSAKVANMTADQLSAATAYIEDLNSNNITASDISADHADIDTLKANTADIDTIRANSAKVNNLTADQLSATTAYIEELSSENITAESIVADVGKIHNLTTDQLSAAVAYIANLNAENITAESIVADIGKIHNLTVDELSAAAAYIANLTAGNISASQIVADHASVTELKAATADIDEIRANSAKVSDLTADQLSATTAYIGDLTIGRVTAQQIIADHMDFDTVKANAAKVANLTAIEIEADHATVNSLDSNFARINLANVDNAWIESGVVRDGAITNAMINSVSANKLTAGTIDASNITVTNLNADNITTGTINGQRIGDGSLDLGKLSEPVYTEAEVDAIANGLNDRIDAAIETYTSDAVPTLSNYPASSWDTSDKRVEHVGDVCYVVNAASQADGYCYRFTYDNRTNLFGWQLIKDSDVTAALQRLIDAEGDIDGLQTFQTQTSSWISQTDSSLSSTMSRTSSLETRMTTAEGDISEKVNTSTFNELSQTVGENSSSITTLTETVGTKADSSTVTTLSNTVNTVSQKADSNEASISSLSRTVSDNEEDIEAKHSSLQQDLNGFKTTVSTNYYTKEEVESTYATKTQLTQTDTSIRAHVSETYSTKEELQEVGETASAAADDASSAMTTASQAAASAQQSAASASSSASIAQQAQSAAESVVARADAGEFDGATGPKGDTGEMSAEQLADLAQAKSDAATAKDNAEAAAADASDAKTSATSALTKVTTIESDYVKDADLVATSSEILGTVSDTYATKTTVSDLGGRVTTVEGTISSHDTSIRANSETIALKANASSVYSKTETDGLISTEVTNRNAAIEAATDAIELSVSESYATKQELSDGVDGATAYVDTEVASAKAAIKVTTDGISTEVAKKVDSGSIISTINQSAESVTIDASRVNIAGATLFTSGRLSQSSLDGAYDANGAAASAQSAAISAAASDASTKAATAKSEAIAAAAQDATSKADAAESSAKSYAETQAGNVNSSLETYKTATNATLTSLQNQVDGQIEAWYKSVDPTSSNEPASTWDTDALKARHEGDIYYNVENGHSWRWMRSGTAYAWQRIPDSDAAAALAAAQDAQATANTKRRIFTATPTVPYDVGDLWVSGTSVKYARTAKGPTELYAESDWSVTATDDTLANSALGIANAAAPKSQAVSEEQYVYITKAAGTGSIDGTTTWVTKTDYSANTWTTKRPQYDPSYPVLFVAKQTKTVAGTVTCTTPLIDDTTTVIDGGNITTGTIDANRIATGSLSIGHISGLQTSLDGKADDGDIPTNVSQLSNDSGYATTTQVGTAKTEAIGAAAQDATTKANNAAMTATSYITATASEGIKVHDSNDTNTYVKIVSGVIDMVRSGASMLRAWVDGTTAKVRVGLETAAHVIIDNTGMSVNTVDGNATKSVAKFGPDGARVGTADGQHATVDSNGFSTYDGDTQTARISGGLINIGSDDSDGFDFSDGRFYFRGHSGNELFSIEEERGRVDDEYYYGFRLANPDNYSFMSMTPSIFGDPTQSMFSMLMAQEYIQTTDGFAVEAGRTDGRYHSKLTMTSDGVSIDCDTCTVRGEVREIKGDVTHTLSSKLDASELTPVTSQLSSVASQASSAKAKTDKLEISTTSDGVIHFSVKASSGNGEIELVYNPYTKNLAARGRGHNGTEWTAVKVIANLG